MKTKIFALFAAMMLLVGTTAMAQSGDTRTSKTTETEIKGDVNNDGVVDVADIAAVIAVMHEQGTVAPQYYWYVGQENPGSMTSISPVVSDNTSPGWRLIGTSVPTYSSSNMLYNPNVATIVTGTTLQYNYIAIPTKSSAIMRDGGGNPGTSVNLCTLIGTKTIENVVYNIYKTNSKAKKLGYPIY